MNWTPRQVSAFALLSDPKVKRAALLGGSRSGKSYTIAHKIVQRAKEFPGCGQFVVRKTREDATDTVWFQTLKPILKIEENAGACKIYEKPAWVLFKNGSFIKVGGLHPSQIDKVLGGEHASIWINEASEIAWQSVSPCLTRLNDRTPHKDHGRPVVPKLYVDFNPPTVKHWTHKAFIRRVDPITEKPFADAESWGWMRMNPGDNLQNLAAGYLETLESMSERDRQRFLLGEFGQLSGLVYDNFEPDRHIYDSFDMPHTWPLYLSIDFGFTHPFVCLWAYYDKANETIYVEDEHYLSKVTINDHARMIKERLAGNAVEAIIADHDAGDREVLHRAGLFTEKADKDVKSGINTVYDMFSRGKIQINRRCANLINELYAYQWKESSKRDEPIKENDHALDALRYLVMALSVPSAKPAFYRAR